MKRFKHYSNKAAKNAALEDMKKAHVNYNIFWKENVIRNLHLNIVRI